MSESKDIELRSEKVRNIIGQIPPIIIRIGIAVICMVVFTLLAGAYLFKFDYIIKIPVKLYMENSQVYYTIEMPYSRLNNLEIGQKIIITVHDGSNFTSTIQNIDTTLRINKEQAYFQIHGLIDNTMLKVDGQVEAQGSVYIGKTNVIDYVLKSQRGESVLSQGEELNK